MIEIRENINDVEEFNYLYDCVGWGSYDYNLSKKSLEKTIYSVSVYIDNQIVGYGRMIGDGVCFLYIHDVMVHPKYQNKNIGTKIMNALLKNIDEIRKINPDVRVYLGAQPNKEAFYRKFGFITRAEANLGEEMILKK